MFSKSKVTKSDQMSNESCVKCVKSGEESESGAGWRRKAVGKALRIIKDRRFLRDAISGPAHSIASVQTKAMIVKILQIEYLRASHSKGTAVWSVPRSS